MVREHDAGPRYWGQYWTRENILEGLGTPLRKVWSAQYKRLRVGDELWIWGFVEEPRRFVAIGRITVGSITPDTDPASNRLIVRPPPAKIEDARAVDLTRDWGRIRTLPGEKELSRDVGGFPDPKSLQTMRRLTESSRGLILKRWEGRGLAQR